MELHVAPPSPPSCVSAVAGDAMSHGDGKEGQNRLRRSPSGGLGRLERKAEGENGADTGRGEDYQVGSLK